MIVSHCLIRSCEALYAESGPVASFKSTPGFVVAYKMSVDVLGTRKMVSCVTPALVSQRLVRLRGRCCRAIPCTRRAF